MRIAQGFRWISVLVLLFGFASAALPPRTAAQVVVSVSFGPPELPVHEQPLCPGDGYIWTPGYWAWDPDDDDYYWYRALGFFRRRPASFGHPATGAGMELPLSSTKVIGDRWLVFMEASTTASDILAMAMKEAAGITTGFITTAASIT